MACIHPRGLAYNALARLEPGLDDTAVVVCDGDSLASRVIDSNRLAAGAGIRPGMKVSQVLGLVAGCIVRRHSPAAVRAALSALVDMARRFSPRVAKDTAGNVYLGLRGTSSLWPSKEQLAHRLHEEALALGLPVGVGVAAGSVAARLAAMIAEPVLVVEALHQPKFLADLPVAMLGGGAEALGLMAAMGIERIGQLAALDGDAIVRRFGPEGLSLWRKAHGQDDPPLAWQPEPELFAGHVALPEPVGDLGRLGFALERLCSDLACRLERRGLAAAALLAELKLESGEHARYPLRFAFPNCRASLWVELLRARVEKDVPAGPVTDVSVEALPAERIRSQLSFFASPATAPGDMEALFRRLEARVGHGRVGSPRPVGDCLPGRFEMLPFPPPASPGKANWVPDELEQPPPRILRPPARVVLELDGDRPARIISPSDFRGRIVRHAGPWRLEGRWWDARPQARHYYQAELERKRCYRLYRTGQSWFVDAIYG